MKTKSTLLILAGLAATLMAPAAFATATTRTAVKPQSLQVVVSGPIGADFFYSDRISDALFDRLADVFHREGFTGNLEQVRFADETKDGPQLHIHLLEWRATRLGDIECRFTAELQVGGESRSLGVFTGTTPWITRSRSWAFRDLDFTYAAEEAGRDLMRALKQSEFMLRYGV